jgi:hypothetical protein
VKALSKFMQKSDKFMIGLFVLLILLGLQMFRGRAVRPSNSARNLAIAAAQNTNHPIVHAQRPAAVVETTEETNPGFPQIAREKVEEYLRRHNRDAASLLAAFHALKDTNYLNEAAANFPNDPHLQWTVLARDAFPEDRRKWLDNFKASSPSNSLANYLSAQDYFKNHQPEAAMKEMAAATGKSQFTDYSMETILDAEDLYRFSGSSAAETRTAAMGVMASDLLPALSQFKDVARGLQDLQHQYANSGDSASVQALAQTGIDFANRFTSGENCKFPITELVGNASQAIVLESLDQNTSYDFLGGETPAQRLAKFQQEKASLRDLTKGFATAFGMASEDQLSGYWERVKVYGELPAMRWLVQQNAVTPNSGN